MGDMPGLVAGVRRLPLTTCLVTVVILLAIVTRALRDPLVTRALGASTTDGLPAFESGSWWTVDTGAFFAAQPLRYIPILFGLILFGGFAEWRLGTGRTAIALVVTHVFAVLGTALLLWATRDLGYQWATDLAGRRDAGASAAFLGAAAAATVTLHPPWRGASGRVLRHTCQL